MNETSLSTFATLVILLIPGYGWAWDTFTTWKSPWDGKTYYQCMIKGGLMTLTEDKSACLPKEEADRIMDKKIRQMSQEPKEKKRENSAESKPITGCAAVDYAALAPLIDRSDQGGRHVYVTRLWHGVKYHERQGLARYLATCRSEGGWVEIYDTYTGKKLAKWGALGYSAYE